MTSKRRVHRLEASLDAKKKFFLWLHRVKAAGGYVAYWELELKGPLVPFEWFEDEGAHFLFRLVNDVNLTILKNADTNQDLRTLAHCAMDGVVRRICRPDQSGVLVPDCPIPEVATRAGMYVCTKFKTLLEETLSLASAIHVISETHLGGEDILFADTRAALEVESANLRVTADMCGHLAAWLNGEPIAVDGFTSGHPMVDAKVNEIVHISRAEALASCSDLRKFKEALQEAFPELVEGDRR